MRHFIIEHSATGHVFGAYTGADGGAAIRDMLRDSGDDQGKADSLTAVDVRYVEGRKAVRYAKALRALNPGSATLVKAADPTEGERVGLSYDEAEDICAEDPSLVRLAVS